MHYQLILLCLDVETPVIIKYQSGIGAYLQCSDSTEVGVSATDQQQIINLRCKSSNEHQPTPVLAASRNDLNIISKSNLCLQFQYKLTVETYIIFFFFCIFFRDDDNHCLLTVSVIHVLVDFTLYQTVSLQRLFSLNALQCIWILQVNCRWVCFCCENVNSVDQFTRNYVCMH